MATMRAVQVSRPGGDFELVEREVPEPGFGEALVRVDACGICHSDSMAKNGGFPGTTHPLIPGTRSRAQSRRWGRAFTAGKSGSASGSAGTEGTATTASGAGAAT